MSIVSHHTVIQSSRAKKPVGVITGIPENISKLMTPAFQDNICQKNDIIDNEFSGCLSFYSSC